MANKISRRQILGLGAATIAGVGVLGKAGHASNHGGGSAQYQPANRTTEISGRPSVLGEELQRRADRCETVSTGITRKGL